MTEITQADRELLAAEYEVIGQGMMARWARAKSRHATYPLDWGQMVIPIHRAIAKARAQGREEALREAAGVCDASAADYVDEHWSGQFGEVRSALGDVSKDILALIEKDANQ